MWTVPGQEEQQQEGSLCGKYAEQSQAWAASYQGVAQETCKAHRWALLGGTLPVLTCWALISAHTAS